MLASVAVVVCLFAIQFVVGEPIANEKTVKYSIKPKNISQNSDNNGMQSHSLLNIRQKYTQGGNGIASTENINSSRRHSDYVYTEQRDNSTDLEHVTGSSESSNASTLKRNSTKDVMTVEEKQINITEQSNNKATGSSMPGPRLGETITGGSKQITTTRGLVERDRQGKDQTKAAIQAKSKPGSVDTGQLNAAQAYQNANARLKTFILNQQNIVYRLAPYNINNKGPTNTSGVFLKFTPFRILFLDEVQQSITVSCYMMVKWYDTSFTWDPLQFGNIKETLIKSSNIWTPTIVLPTSTGHGLYLDTTEYLLVTPKPQPTGTVFSMKFPFQFTAQCDFDMLKYPFDQQTCVIIFRELNQRNLSALNIKDADFEMAKSLHTSGEWEIIDWQHLDNSEEEPFTLRWRMTLRRQSHFYVANLLIPLMQTSLMTLLVFWIPAESGEKMSYVVSMFVSTSVFLFTINDEMPRSIRELPTINVVVVAVTSEIILVAMASLCVLRRCRYLQKVNTINKSLKFATELGQQSRNAEDNCGVKVPCQVPMAVQNGHYSIGNNAFAAQIKSDSSAKMSFKFGFSEHNNQQKICVDGLYSHETLDMIFFCVFVLINLFGGIIAYFSWF